VATETQVQREPYSTVERGGEAPRKAGDSPSSSGRKTTDGSSLAERVKSLQLPPHVSAHRFHWRSLVKWAIALVIIGGGVVGGQWYLQHSRGHAAKAAATETSSTSTGTQSASAPAPSDPAAGDVVLESKGYVVAVHEILISPKIPGMVEEFNVIEGQRVKKGQTLAILESVDYKADLDHCQATLDGAKQRLLELQNGSRPEEIEEARNEAAEANEQLSQLKSTFERTKRLHDSGTKVVTQNEYEIAEAAYLAMVRRVDRLNNAYKLMKIGPRKEKIDAAKADVALAQADFDKAKWRFDNCTVRAPISGTILKKNAEQGNIVNPIVQNGSYSICMMANLADLEVDLMVQERDVANVFVGQHCKAHTDAYPDRIYDGAVSRLMPIADRGKGAIPVRVKLNIPPEEEGVYFKPEMGAVVSFYKKGLGARD
jgi:HlyD family secretion protein